ncbi:MAG: hypothetical protein QOE82_3203 [Thermoanaerobaculia bacterium]|nr:hypothetical protein [Thermoanaerobaculia bacterium]
MAALLVSFVLLFYVPTLLFRFFATLYIDLGRRKIANQIEDFFAAALPSVFLNILAWFIVNTVTMWRLAELTGAVPLLLTSDTGTLMRQNMLLVSSYYAVLLLTAASCGAIYGWVELRMTLLEATVARNLSGELWRWALRVHDFWAIFFRAERVPLFPWIVRKTYVFARTDRLYYGLVESYDRNSDGEIAGITLVRVRRFSEKSREECLAGDTDYIRRLYGSFYLKWSTITDINIADIDHPTTMVKIQREFRRARQHARTARAMPARLKVLTARIERLSAKLS